MYLNTASRNNENKNILLECINENNNIIYINFEFNKKDTSKNIIEELKNENLHFINYYDLYYFLKILLKNTRIFKISN